uniref:Uncharacterized protein n=1 Tax=Dictyoglomus turgidum TaxID=513050 RepID=A0A7C3SRH5_9BACT
MLCLRKFGMIGQHIIIRKNMSYKYNPFLKGLDYYEFGGGGGVATFLGLSDTPSSYTGEAGKYVAVNSTETALEFVAPVNSFVPYTGAIKNLDLGAHNLIVDTNTLFVDSVNHRVGIGTTAPNDKLTINGNIVPVTNSAFNLGNSSNYWANAYINNVYYNSSASINGTSHSGSLTFLNSVDNPSFYFQSPGGYYFRISLFNNISGYEYVDFSRSSYFSKGFRFDSHLVPANSLSNNIGNSSSYWLNTYTQNLYLNSTAYLSGATAGLIKVTGALGGMSSLRIPTSAPTSPVSGDMYWDEANNRLGIYNAAAATWKYVALA